MKEYSLTQEFSLPPKEDGPLIEPTGMPKELMAATDSVMDIRKEFEGESGGREPEQADSHRLIKRMMLLPLATTMATLAIVFSSFGFDPLGDDFLNQEWVASEADEEKTTHDGDESKKIREVREYPGDISSVIIDVTYVPTGETYRCEEPGEEGLAEAREWVKQQGGDPDTLTYVRSETILVGRDVSDDAIIVGDPDNPENWYVAQGTVTERYEEIAYFDAYESMEYDQQPEQGQLADMPILVVFVPTGDKYYPTETGQRGLEEAREWIRSIGGDPESMEFVSIRRDKKYELEDGVLSQILMDFAYYEVYEYGEGGEDDNAFPMLSNLDPDYAGDHVGDVHGPEYFVRMILPGDSRYTYLKAGAAWEYFDSAVETTVSGAWYDEDTNTLTLQGFEASELDVNLMGNGFTIRLIGNNYVDKLTVWGFQYGGSLKLTGDGSLVVNDHYANEQGGLFLKAEGSESCLMVDNGVTLECYGNPAVIIYQTTMEDAIYWGAKEEGPDGMEGSDGWTTEPFGYSVHNYTILGGDGRPASYVHIAPKD